jgi:hypothetical protein
MSLPMMARRERPLTFLVRTAGPVARRILSGAAEGRVAAVFGAAFYIETESQMLCLASAAVEPGPLSLITFAPAETDWRAHGLRPQERVALSPLELRVGNHARFPLRGATPWAPEPMIRAPDPTTAARGLTAFRTAAYDLTAPEGLGAFLEPGYMPGRKNPISQAAAAPIAEARRWIAGVIRGERPDSARDLNWAYRLTGLGVGLTPSGDDFLGGTMIALHALGQQEISRALWRDLCPHAREATNAISFALLSAAAEGLGSESVHRMLGAVLHGDVSAIRAGLPGIGRIGHTSGWDAMAGVATALDGWLRSEALAAA